MGFTGDWSVPSVTPAESRPAAPNLTCRLAAAVVRQRSLVGGALGALCPTVRPGVFPAASGSGAAGTAADMGRRGGAPWALELALLVTSACLAGERAGSSRRWGGGGRERGALAWPAWAGRAASPLRRDVAGEGEAARLSDPGRGGGRGARERLGGRGERREEREPCGAGGGG